MKTGQAARDHRRGRRGRGARHARRQQDPRHVQLRRRQGARLRRPPQGDAAGHGRPHRRPGHQRGGRPQARERHARPARLAPSGSSSPRTTPPSSTAAATADDVKGRINQIKAEIENTDSDWDREKLQERLAKLAGGVAVIKVGAATEVELKEKKHRIEDAVSATRAAIEEGVVAGGGTALLRARAAVAEGRRRRSTGDEATGARTVWEALDRARPASSPRTPAWRARSWCRRSRPRRARSASTPPTGELDDLVKAGIIDPAKVTRAALQNAASIAALVLTTECLVADKPEKKAHRRCRPAAAAWAAWVAWAAWG